MVFKCTFICAFPCVWFCSYSSAIILHNIYTWWTFSSWLAFSSWPLALHRYTPFGGVKRLTIRLSWVTDPTPFRLSLCVDCKFACSAAPSFAHAWMLENRLRYLSICCLRLWLFFRVHLSKVINYTMIIVFVSQYHHHKCMDNCWEQQVRRAVCFLLEACQKSRLLFSLDICLLFSRAKFDYKALRRFACLPMEHVFVLFETFLEHIHAGR